MIEGLSPHATLALYLTLTVGLVVVLALLAGRLGPSLPTEAKLKPYECGVSEPVRTETRWPVRFALVAMLFLIFDVETLLVYPWAVVARELGTTGLLGMASFVVVIAVGYRYAHVRGALRWR